MTMGATMGWPAAAVLGFVLLTGLVVLLGASSTARYEFEKQRHGRAAAGGGTGVGHPSGRQPGGPPGGGVRPAGAGLGGRRRGPSRPGTGHPHARLVAGRRRGRRSLAGPFADRIDADWAAFADELPAVSVYGAQRADGTVAVRPSPEERAWLVDLGNQLDRLPAEWDELLDDTDPLTTLVVEVAAALVEAGLPLHDPEDPQAGGVCLMPELARRWRAGQLAPARADGPAPRAGRRGRRHGPAVDERRRSPTSSRTWVSWSSRSTAWAARSSRPCADRRELPATAPP